VKLKQAGPVCEGDMWIRSEGLEFFALNFLPGRSAPTTLLLDYLSARSFSLPLSLAKLTFFLFPKMPCLSVFIPTSERTSVTKANHVCVLADQIYTVQTLPIRR
jgi:hypothetical protein